MTRRLRRATLAARLIIPALAALLARSGFAQPMPDQGKLSRDALQHLLAPVALYPDQVLTDILAAATYPAEIVEADRFLAEPAHANLSGQALQDAAASEAWDPSVKDLLLFPQVLQTMDTNLHWTEQLGQAVIAQQADVMNAVQEFRGKAELAGTLATGNNDLIANEGGDVVISPPSPQDVYLPDYQPQCVFGADPNCDDPGDQIDWGAGFLVPYGYVPWGRIDWPNRRIALHGSLSGGGVAGAWHHQATFRVALAAPSLTYAMPEYPSHRPNIVRPLPVARTVFRTTPHAVFAAPRASAGTHR